MSFGADLDVGGLGGGDDAHFFRFEGGPFLAGELQVVRFTGREAINGLYEFKIELSANRVDLHVLEPALLGQSACLMIGDVPARTVHGIVTSVDLAGVYTGTDHPRVIVELAPRAALMTLRRNSRIFQDLTVRDIVTLLLRENSVQYLWKLSGTYATRTYCVQYQETDWEFVTRLLAEEGIFFAFKHPSGLLSELTGGAAAAMGWVAGVASSQIGGAAGAAAGAAGELLDPGEVMVFMDRAEMYPPISPGDLEDVAVGTVVAVMAAATGLSAGVSPTLTVRSGDGMPPAEHDVSDFALERAVRSKSVLTRQYNFERPRFDQRGDASVEPGDAARATLGIGTMTLPGLTELPLAIPAASLKQYFHHADDDKPDASRQRARTILQQLRADRRVGRGRSWCRRLLPGSRFTLDGHGISQVDREYVVSEVEHEGDTARMFATAGRDGVESRQRYRNSFSCVPSNTPLRPPVPQRKMFQVLEPARVVGPPHEEIFTDSFGRIKVQFFWDNEGTFSGYSSCWIRVVQNWSGGSWGFQFIPRVGMEVMVSFQYGDQDRPVVIGTVYNGENSFPFALPDDKTRSGIRTRSSPGGGGANEISFQDLAGSEQLYVRAQKNLDEDVGHDRSSKVKQNDTLQVGQDQSLGVDRDQGVNVGRNRSVDVRQRETLVVGAGRSTRIGGTDHTLVQRHGFFTTRENYNLQVGRVWNIYVGDHDEPGSLNAWSWGPTQWGTNATHSFEAQEKITLSVGDSKIEMTRDTITLRAPHIVMDGTEDTIIRGKNPQITLNDKALLVASEVKVQSKGATLKMDDALFKVQAPSTILTSGSGADVDERKKIKGETKPFKLKLTNSLFEPYASRPYELVVDTVHFTGTTSGSGEITEQVPKEAIHATVQLWVGDPPTGASRIIQVELLDAVPPASSVPGLKLRLAHLGYFAGEQDAVVDDGLREAIRQFQQDQGMDITGEPSDVAGKVQEVHGS